MYSLVVRTNSWYTTHLGSTWGQQKKNVNGGEHQNTLILYWRQHHTWSTHTAHREWMKRNKTEENMQTFKNKLACMFVNKLNIQDMLGLCNCTLDCMQMKQWTNGRRDKPALMTKFIFSSDKSDRLDDKPKEVFHPHCSNLTCIIEKIRKLRPFGWHFCYLASVFYSVSLLCFFLLSKKQKPNCKRFNQTEPNITLL